MHEVTKPNEIFYSVPILKSHKSLLLPFFEGNKG